LLVKLLSTCLNRSSTPIATPVYGPADTSALEGGAGLGAPDPGSASAASASESMNAGRMALNDTPPPPS
jgi:hypothetical protein